MCLTPRVPIVVGGTQYISVVEKRSGSCQGRELPEGDRRLVVRDTPVPTVMYDRDAHPYFDDPCEEGL